MLTLVTFTFPTHSRFAFKTGSVPKSFTMVTADQDRFFHEKADSIFFSAYEGKAELDVLGRQL